MLAREMTKSVDRDLSNDEQTQLQTLIAQLNDRERDGADRTNDAHALGEIGHFGAIGALARILRNDEEDIEVRRYCAVALARIAHKDSVEALIDVVSHPEIGLNANESLRRLTGAPLPELGVWRPGPEHRDERQQLQENWRKWWRTNSTTVKLNRNSMIF